MSMSDAGPMPTVPAMRPPNRIAVNRGVCRHTCSPLHCQDPFKPVSVTSILRSACIAGEEGDDQAEEDHGE